MISYIKLLVWGICWLPMWSITCIYRRCMKKPEVNNCLSWASRKWETHGGYLVIRWCRSHRWKWLLWPHFMWLPEHCHTDLRHYVPKDDTSDKHILPAPFFEGRVVKGDGEDIIDN